MRYVTLKAVLIVISVFLFSACGGGGDGDNSSVPANGSNDVGNEQTESADNTSEGGAVESGEGDSVDSGEVTGGGDSGDSSEGGSEEGGEGNSEGAGEVATEVANYSAYPFTNLVPLARVTNDWSDALEQTWLGLKSRNIDAYNTGMVHRPKSETPGDAVSEGIGYGMILALYSNDQSYFNKIWDAGEQFLWNGRFYDWRSDATGNIIGTGAATDAEQDIAMMLIFADHLVQRGVWNAGHQSPEGATYASRAQDLLDVIWSDMVDGGRYLRPGNFWGGREMLNVGYFSPAWYRLYKQFDARSDHDWDALVDQTYQTLAGSSGYSRGLVADWSDAWGNTLADGPGYNAYDNGQSMFKDGIRVFWRIATDALWFNEPRAINYLDNAVGFLRQSAAQQGSADNSNSPAHLANFYQLDGSQVPLDDVWTDYNGGNSQRFRNEHSHMTIGMWATAAMGGQDPVAAEAFSRELQLFYEGGSFWGKTSDPTGRNEIFSNNEVYFDQFLAWFGAIILNGNFCNVLTCVRE